MRVFIIAAAFLSLWEISATLSGRKMPEWGVWLYEQRPRPLPFINDSTVSVERSIKTGVVSRNLLLAENMRTKRIYINNLYPIKSVSDQYVQLADVFVGKELLTAAELEILKQANYGGPGVSPVPLWNALKKLVEAVKLYLEFIQAGDVITIIQDILDRYLKDGKSRNYANLNAAKSALSERNTMSRVWNYIHTENILFFDCCFPPVTSLNPGKLVSHLDMCDKCESFFISKIPAWGIPLLLVGSFVPCGNSRQRNGSYQRLQKVVLEDPAAGSSGIEAVSSSSSSSPPSSSSSPLLSSSRGRGAAAAALPSSSSSHKPSPRQSPAMSRFEGVGSSEGKEEEKEKEGKGEKQES